MLEIPSGTPSMACSTRFSIWSLYSSTSAWESMPGLLCRRCFQTAEGLKIPRLYQNFRCLVSWPALEHILLLQNQGLARDQPLHLSTILRGRRWWESRTAKTWHFIIETWISRWTLRRLITSTSGGQTLCLQWGRLSDAGTWRSPRKNYIPLMIFVAVCKHHLDLCRFNTGWCLWSTNGSQ